MTVPVSDDRILSLRPCIGLFSDAGALFSLTLSIEEHCVLEVGHAVYAYQAFGLDDAHAALLAAAASIWLWNAPLLSMIEPASKRLPK